MKYKYLGSKVSLFQIRLGISILIIAGLTLIGTYFFEKDMDLLLLGVVISLWAYLASKFSNIKYNSEEIVIQNFKGSTHFLKSDFVQIKPLRSYLNFYVMVFKNNKSYVFGLPSSKMLLTDRAKENSLEMERELLSNEVGQ
jgi:hypothetical protein